MKYTFDELKDLCQKKPIVMGPADLFVHLVEAFPRLMDEHSHTKRHLEMSDQNHHRLQKENNKLRKKLQIWHQVAIQMAALSKTMFTLEGE